MESDVEKDQKDIRFESHRQSQGHNKTQRNISHELKIAPQQIITRQ